MFCRLPPQVVLLSLTSSYRPQMADCPSDVGPPHFLAKGPSFCCSPHTWLGRVAVCMICALGLAGSAAHVIHQCLDTRTQRVLFLFFFCGCCLAGTPLHVPLLGLGWMDCSVVVPRLRTW